MKPEFILVMGVAGCGKTSVGKELASRLSWKFFDADDFHSPENIAKMRSGMPLSDADRAAWLEDLHTLVADQIKEHKPAVLACSALKEKYREILLRDCQDVLIIYLKGSYELIWARMKSRFDHYMKPNMLQSQFDTLEEPTDALVISIASPVDEIVTNIIEKINSNLRQF